MNPFPIKNTRASNKTGVKNFPIMSITLLGRIVNSKVTAKKITEKTAELIPDVKALNA